MSRLTREQLLAASPRPWAVEVLDRGGLAFIRPLKIHDQARLADFKPLMAKSPSAFLLLQDAVLLSDLTEESRKELEQNLPSARRARLAQRVWQAPTSICAEPPFSDTTSSPGT